MGTGGKISQRERERERERARGREGGRDREKENRPHEKRVIDHNRKAS